MPTRGRGVRAALGGTALVLLWALIGASSVVATPNAPGNNGTLKVHAESEPDDPNSANRIRNQPHPGCTFHLHGFHFDDGSSGQWRIESWPPTGNKAQVAAGTWSDGTGNGEWWTSEMSLDPGHYKAYAKQMSPSTPGGWKQKVFWIECETAGGEQPGGGGNGGGGNGGGGNGGKPATPPGGSELGGGGAAGGGPRLTLPPTTTLSDQRPQGTGSVALVLIGLVFMGTGLLVLAPRPIRIGR